MRDLTTEQQAALEGAVVRPVLFAKLDFPTSPVLVHSGVGTITFNSEDYLGVGSYGGVSKVTEGAEARPYDIDLTLSGIPTEIIAETLGDDYQGQLAVLYVGLLNSDHVLLGEPKCIWSGYMDYPDISLGKTATIVVHCRGRANDWSRSRVERYTKEQQRADYPDDSGLDYIAQMEDKQIYWGAV